MITFFLLLQKNVVHRDLKLGNMVLNKHDRRVTLTNFCLGKHLVCESDLLKDQRGSPAYISPDVLCGKKDVFSTNKKDVFSTKRTINGNFEKKNQLIWNFDHHHFFCHIAKLLLTRSKWWRKLSIQKKCLIQSHWLLFHMP